MSFDAVHDGSLGHAEDGVGGFRRDAINEVSNRDAGGCGCQDRCLHMRPVAQARQPPRGGFGWLRSVLHVHGIYVVCEIRALADPYKPASVTI